MLFFCSACGMGIKESQQSKEKREKKEREAAGRKETRKVSFKKFKEQITISNYPWLEYQKRYLRESLGDDEYCNDKYNVFVSDWNIKDINPNVLFYGDGYIGVKEDLDDGNYRFTLFYKNQPKASPDFTTVSFNDE